MGGATLTIEHFDHVEGATLTMGGATLTIEVLL
jgi:hypothetical protein